MFPSHIPNMILTSVHLLGKDNSIILKFHAFKRSIQILRHVGQSLCMNLLTSLNIHKRNRFTDCLFKPNSKHLLNVRLQKGSDCGRKQVKKNLSHDVVT